jgi:hypothetical protein
MWRVIALTACVAAGGCAAHHVPPRLISTSWSTVSALAPGTEVGVAAEADENSRPDGGKWTLFIAGTTIGAAVGAAHAPVERYREQVIYIRPVP